MGQHAAFRPSYRGRSARYVSRGAFDPELGADPDERIAGQLGDVDTVLAKLTLLLQYWDDVSRNRSATA